MSWFKYWTRTSEGTNLRRFGEYSNLEELFVVLRGEGHIILSIEQVEEPQFTAVTGMSLLSGIAQALKGAADPDILHVSYDGDHKDASLILTVQGTEGEEDWILRSNDIQRLED